jgi:beta-glucosidase
MTLLGYDIGSSSVKASVIEADSGRLLASAFHPREEMAIDSPQPGFAEQDPEAWWNSLGKATHELLQHPEVNPADVKAIGISYQMHGLVIVDRSLKSLRPSIIWCDSRAVSTGEKAFREMGSEKCLSSLLNSPGNFTASKLKWVKDNEPSIYSKIYKIMLPGDYIAMKLSDEILTTPSGLSEGIFWDFNKNQISDMILDHFGFDQSFIPEVVPSFSLQGILSVKAAKELGLKAGVPIAYRAGDQPNNAFSLNVLNPGEIAATAGTSGVVYGISDQVSYDPESRVNTFAHVNHSPEVQRLGVLLCVNGTGILNSWLKRSLSGNAMSYDDMNRLASEVPAGSAGLCVLPFGNGAERLIGNKDLGCSFEGLDFNRHGNGHLIRAAHEGIAFAFNYGMDIMKQTGINARVIRAGNSNMFLSPVFRESLASVTNATIELYNTDGSQGAARAAGLGAGIYKNPEEAFKGLKVVKTVQPNDKLKEPLMEALNRWKTILNNKLQNTFSRLPVLLLLPVIFFFLTGCREKVMPWMDTSLSFEERTELLLSQMTLQEKVDFLRYDSPGIERLGIPEYNWWNECLHGLARSGYATVFPQAIGMAAMWDTDAMFSIANVISDEARAKHHDYVSRGKRNIYQGLTFWTPNINIFRDPRWGRGMETYGEDPYLAGELAVPFVKGLQGDDEKYLKLVATVKHFAVHSGPEPLRHSFDVWPSERDLVETYLPHFKKSIQVGGAYSVMCAYQRFRGMPCCGSTYLENLLRNHWGFEGYIVSDCWAIHNFYMEDRHHVVSTMEEAAAMAVKAGTDLNCGSSYPALVKAVEDGLITEAEIDVSVRRLILARMKLGMFDPEAQVSYAQIPISVLDSPEHKRLAGEAARKSIVLLKNENNLLPLSKDVKKVAVIGPNADNLDALLANYNGFPTEPVTPLEGIRRKLPNAEVGFALGCDLAENFPYFEAIPVENLFADASLSENGLNAAYFKNLDRQGKPFLTRIDKNVDFVWGDQPPARGIAYDYFSASWEGFLVPPMSGEYALGGEGFSGFSLYVDGELFTQWHNEHHPAREYELVFLEEGKSYQIKLEYFQDNTEYATMRLLWSPPRPNMMAEAVELAASSDLVIFFMGLSPFLEGEEMNVRAEGFEGGDRVSIDLPATQTRLMKEIHKLGKPMVMVLLNGSALAINWEAENIPAIIEAWYPGQDGGNAIADVIFGDYNPAGRLPVTFYRSVNDIPPFEDYDMEGKTYRYFRGKPLYEFGFGLSYTTFEYSNLVLPESITAGETLLVSVTVTNTGAMDGDEVVQLYVSHPDAKIPAAIRSLQGFRRVHLKAGASRTVELILHPEQLAVFGDDMRVQVQPGRVLLSVGGKQPDAIALAKKQVVQADVKITGGTYFVNQ